MITATTRPF